jgi:predicted transcriptional regulator with HTH domain
MEDVSNSMGVEYVSDSVGIDYINDVLTNVNNTLTKMYYRFTIREFLIMLVMVFIVVNVMKAGVKYYNVNSDYTVPIVTGVVVYVTSLVT